MLERVERIKEMPTTKKITIYASSSLGGYHCEIILFRPLTERAIYLIRYELGDDLNRLFKDMFSDDSRFRNVLYVEKIIVKGGKMFHYPREKLFILAREFPTSKWKSLNNEVLL